MGEFALVKTLRTHRATQAAEKLFMGPAYHDADLAFGRPDGSPIPPWNFGSAFRDLALRAGVTRVRLHDFRDTHSSLLAKAGVPIEVVSKRLAIRRSRLPWIVTWWSTVTELKRLLSAFEALAG